MYTWQQCKELYINYHGYFYRGKSKVMSTLEQSKALNISWEIKVHLYCNIPYASVWLERSKSKMIENDGRIEKWENKKYFNFSHFCLVESGNVDR